jgi:hypothetical protein
MPTWLMPLIFAILDPNGPLKTIADVIAIGKANGMTDLEAMEIDVFYATAIARRKADAGLPD